MQLLPECQAVVSRVGGSTKSIFVGAGNAIFLIAEPDYKTETNKKGEKINRIVNTSGEVLKVSYKSIP